MRRCAPAARACAQVCVWQEPAATRAGRGVQHALLRAVPQQGAALHRRRPASGRQQQSSQQQSWQQQLPQHTGVVCSVLHVPGCCQCKACSGCCDAQCTQRNVRAHPPETERTLQHWLQAVRARGPGPGQRNGQAACVVLCPLRHAAPERPHTPQPHTRLGALTLHVWLHGSLQPWTARAPCRRTRSRWSRHAPRFPLLAPRLRVARCHGRMLCGWMRHQTQAVLHGMPRHKRCAVPLLSRVDGCVPRHDHHGQRCHARRPALPAAAAAQRNRRLCSRHQCCRPLPSSFAAQLRRLLLRAAAAHEVCACAPLAAVADSPDLAASSS
jgi:hypothetical protein